MEPGAGTVSDRDAQLPLATGRVPERHVDDLPRVGELQGGGEQHRGIHTTQTTPPSSPTGMAYPHQTAKGLFILAYIEEPPCRNGVYPSMSGTKNWHHQTRTKLNR